MQYIFFTLCIVALASNHPGAFFFIAGLALLYHAKDKDGERADLIGGFIGCTVLSIALWLVESF